MNTEFLVLFNKENFNRKDFNKKILLFLCKCNDLTFNEGEGDDGDIFPYLDFYYYDYEYISADMRHIVYLFDVNAKFITRIRLLRFKDPYNYTSIVNCLFEEVSDHVKDKHEEFYLYWYCPCTEA
jgi:hypothetical protein